MLFEIIFSFYVLCFYFLKLEKKRCENLFFYFFYKNKNWHQVLLFFLKKWFLKILELIFTLKFITCELGQVCTVRECTCIVLKLGSVWRVNLVSGQSRAGTGSSWRKNSMWPGWSSELTWDPVDRARSGQKPGCNSLIFFY